MITIDQKVEMYRMRLEGKVIVPLQKKRGSVSSMSTTCSAKQNHPIT